MDERRSQWATRSEGGSRTALRFLRFVALRAPRPVGDALIDILSLIFTLRPRRPEAIASAAYLSKVFGRPPSFREQWSHNRAFGHVAMDRVRLLAQGVGGFDIRFHGAQLIRDRVESGQGAILLGAHFGSFEALRGLERELPSMAVHYLMFNAHAEASTELLASLNPEVAARVIPLSNGPAAMLAAAEVLERGDFVGILGDRSPMQAGGSRPRARFFDGEIALPASPYMIAMSARAPIILCFAVWRGRGRYEIEFSELYDGAGVPPADRRTRAQELATRYCARLEDLCRAHPYNWFNFFDIWDAGG